MLQVSGCSLRCKAWRFSLWLSKLQLKKHQYGISIVNVYISIKIDEKRKCIYMFRYIQDVARAARKKPPCFTLQAAFTELENVAKQKQGLYYKVTEQHYLQSP